MLLWNCKCKPAGIRHHTLYRCDLLLPSPEMSLKEARTVNRAEKPVPKAGRYSGWEMIICRNRMEMMNLSAFFVGDARTPASPMASTIRDSIKVQTIKSTSASAIKVCRQTPFRAEYWRDDRPAFWKINYFLFWERLGAVVSRTLISISLSFAFSLSLMPSLSRLPYIDIESKRVFPRRAGGDEEERTCIGPEHIGR